MKCIKNVVLFTLFAMNLVDQPAPEVTIEQGTLVGKVSDDGSFFEYIGIPYATTNSSTRFKAPLPPPSWDGVYKAIDDIYSCPQSGLFSGEEDCLKINVYVPSTAKGPMSVMVFIHGGAFSFGSGSKFIYGADFIVKHDVILVTFNYRIGVLGFTCLNIKEAPGNAGLKDQVAALRWIKKNIAGFGGDPDNITLFGESAGGASTSLLIASHATEGLFSKAIEQSGSALSHWAFSRNPVLVASLIAKELGYNTRDPHELYEILSKAHFKELVRASEKALRYESQYIKVNKEPIQLPCIEKTFAGEEAILDDLPYNLINKRQKNIPYIFGSTSKEGLFLTYSNTDDTMKLKEKDYLFASDLVMPTKKKAEIVNNRIKETYFGKEGLSMRTHANFTKLVSDLFFILPGMYESEIMASNIHAPVYNYYFDYVGNRNFLKIVLGDWNEPGACHTDELFYLFNPKVFPFPITKRDQNMINLMTRLWTNFAKYSNPTPPNSDLPIKWIPSKMNKVNILHIDEKPKMGSIPDPDTYRLWKDIYNKYRKTDFSK